MSGIFIENMRTYTEITKDTDMVEKKLHNATN